MCPINRHINGAFKFDSCSTGASTSRPRTGFSSLKKIPTVLPYYSSLFIFILFYFFFSTLPRFLSVVTEIRVDGPSPCKGVYYRPGKRCLRCSKRAMLQEFEVGQLKEDAASRCSLSQIACNNCFLSFVKSPRVVPEFSFSFSLLYLLDEIVIISIEL